MEIAPEVSDVPCPNCGAMLVYRRGRFGKFLACPRFPECRYTQTLLTYIEAPCPKCGKRLIERINRKGRKFYGCEDYPACDFVSWDMPVKEACPKCGGYMTLKYLRGGATARVCQNESCRYREEVKSEDADE